MKKIAVIGYGALGKIFVKAALEKLSGSYEIEGVYDIEQEKVKRDLGQMGICAYSSVDELLKGEAEYVVEIASGQAVHEHGVKALNAGKNLIITSVGALADEKLKEDLEMAANENGKKVMVTSGAVGGFDLLRTFELMGNNKAKIENFKAPASLKGAPYFETHPLSETEKKLVFSGNAKEAIIGFPKNVNVAVASAIASVGTEKMQVEITSCPGEENRVCETFSVK